MINKTLILIAKKNNVWIEIVQTFGLSKEEAEDAVQDMYIKIKAKLENGTSIMYGDEINYYYIYKTLKSIAYDFNKKNVKMPMVSIDDDLQNVKYKFKDLFTADKPVKYDESYNKILEKLDKMYWYDQKVFDIINQGIKIAQLSRESNITYASLVRTYNRVKKTLKEQI